MDRADVWRRREAEGKSRRSCGRWLAPRCSCEPNLAGPRPTLTKCSTLKLGGVTWPVAQTLLFGLGGSPARTLARMRQHLTRVLERQRPRPVPAAGAENFGDRGPCKAEIGQSSVHSGKMRHGGHPQQWHRNDRTGLQHNRPAMHSQPYINAREGSARRRTGNRAFASRRRNSYPTTQFVLGTPIRNFFRRSSPHHKVCSMAVPAAGARFFGPRPA